MVTCFCNVVSHVGFVLSNSSAAVVAGLNSCYGRKILVFVLVRAIVVGDVFGKLKVERRKHGK